jgi:hypothetical protein
MNLGPEEIDRLCEIYLTRYHSHFYKGVDDLETFLYNEMPILRDQVARMRLYICVYRMFILLAALNEAIPIIFENFYFVSHEYRRFMRYQQKVMGQLPDEMKCL